MKLIVYLASIYIYSLSQPINILKECLDITMDICLNSNLVTQTALDCFINKYKYSINNEEHWQTYTQFHIMSQVQCAQYLINNKFEKSLQLITSINQIYKSVVKLNNLNQIEIQNLQIEMNKINQQIVQQLYKIQENRIFLENIIQKQTFTQIQIVEQWNIFQQEFKSVNNHNMDLIKQNGLAILTIREILRSIYLKQSNYQILVHLLYYFIYYNIFAKISKLQIILLIVSLDLNFIEQFQSNLILFIIFPLTTIYQWNQFKNRNRQIYNSLMNNQKYFRISTPNLKTLIRQSLNM